MGVGLLLLIWWGVTLPVFSEAYTIQEVVPTGVWEEIPDPVTGEPVRVEGKKIVERTETRERALVNPPGLETPWNTAKGAWRELTRKEPGLLHHILWSTFRIVMGFVIASVVAVPLGIAMGLFPRLRAAALPLISFLRPLP
ncbi:MAG: ABC transporter permease, partial [Planctomycetota bacterium]